MLLRGVDGVCVRKPSLCLLYEVLKLREVVCALGLLMGRRWEQGGGFACSLAT
jgi:hypothetical protein